MSYRQSPEIATRIADSRERILAAARALVAEGGWRHTNIALVAARADVAIGSIYRHFPSKADLFSEVLAAVSAREAEIVAAITRSDGPYEARLRDAVATFSHRALKGQRLAYALIAEPCEPEIDAARLVWRRALSEAFLELVEAGQRAGAFRQTSPSVAAASIVGACMEALVGPLAPENVADTGAKAALVDDIVENCARILRPGD